MIVKVRTGFALLLFFLGVLLVSSCAMKQNIILNRDGSGSVDFEMKLAPYFTDVASQLSELVPSEDQAKPKDGNFFNIARLKEDFSKRKGVVLKKLESPTPDKLVGSFTFSDINTAVTNGGETKNSGIFSFTNDGDVSTLAVDINYQTLESLFNDNPSMNSPLMENFGPLANKDISEADYLDMMEYALGKESRQGIIDSMLDITFKVDGIIASQSGGKKLDSHTVKFSIPLINILVIKAPLHYAVVFK